MKILITGANGFLGSWLCRVALEQPENQVIACVRKGADTTLIPKSSSIQITFLDYSSVENLSKGLANHGEIDLLIHNAGLTSSMKRKAFFDVNEGLTKNLVGAIQQSKILKKGKLAYISSQAALGPKGANHPVSSYGESKLAAEKVIKNAGLSYIIFRPTGIYGPGDIEFLKLFKSVQKGIYPCAAPKNQKVTLIHAYDVAKNVVELSTSQQDQTIHLSDGNVYSHLQMKEFIEQAIKTKSRILYVPNSITQLYLKFIEIFSRLFGTIPIMTAEKHAEISKDWDHDFSLERKEIPLNIKFQLREGFFDTAASYSTHNLL